MIFIKIFRYFTLLLLSLLLVNCSKGVRNISSSSELGENEGILIFRLDHKISPMLSIVAMNIEGFDINDPKIPKIASMELFIKFGTSLEYKYILPAGRYRIEKVRTDSEDQTITQGTDHIVELEYKPRFSFYVKKGVINNLGIIYLERTETKNHINAFPLQDAKRTREVFYLFVQKPNASIVTKFRAEYRKLTEQTSGDVYQTIYFRPWNRVYGDEDALKRAPQFESGYNRVTWNATSDVGKNLLYNLYQTAKIENISNYRFIDHTKTGEIAIYDFNNLQGIQYQNGGLYKVTVIQAGKFEETFEKMKLLYGLYNKEGDKIIWRMVNTMITLEKLDDNFVRITRVSMEYIRKVATLKPSEIGTIQPTETTLRPAIAQPAATPAIEPSRTENTQPSGQ